MNLKKFVRSIPNYPKKGILFRDITSLIENPRAFKYALTKMHTISKKIKHNKIAGVESRGFIFASALAYVNKKPLVLIRKKNKLPGKKISQKFNLEYAIDNKLGEFISYLINSINHYLSLGQIGLFLISLSYILKVVILYY